MRRGFATCAIWLLSLCGAFAGMTTYDLNDVVRLRLEDISFFTVALLLCGLGIKLLWNYVARDFPQWPRLTYGKALGLTALLSLFMVMVLSMISGARELLTPGAWQKQGHAYHLNDPVNEPLRRGGMESLRTALMNYAAAHNGKFPPHDFTPEIPEKIWQSPDLKGTRYLYVAGFSAPGTNSILACEPMVFGEERFALFSTGEIRKMSTQDIRRMVEANSKP